MKLSSSLISILVFIAITTAAFIWMAMRPAVEGNAMIFGMPNIATTTANTEPQSTKAEPAKAEVNMPESAPQSAEDVKTPDTDVPSQTNESEMTEKSVEEKVVEEVKDAVSTQMDNSEKPAETSMPAANNGTATPGN